MVSFAKKAYLEFNFTAYTTGSKLDEAIRNITYLNGSTATGCGLIKTQELFQSARKDVPHVLVVLTDGKKNRGPSITKPSTELKNDKVFVISVGLGQKYNISELNQIASQPSSDYVYTSEFSNMADIVAKVKEQMCHGKASTLLCLNWVTNGVSNFFPKLPARQVDS